ncbi:MAG: hypothetical protein LH618_19505, partial [Saprospiraceae bacterium]|nr:hypothetical protein [Saprospiraceae bacterium]
YLPVAKTDKSVRQAVAYVGPRLKSWVKYPVSVKNHQSIDINKFYIRQFEPPQIHLWPTGAPRFENRRDEPEQAKDWCQWRKSRASTII